MTLAVMAKAPRPGRTMTRLTPPCTPEEAARLATAALTDTLQAVTTTEGTHTVVVLDGEPGAWLPAGCEVIPQGRGGLAERMAEAFDQLGGPTLMVGADTPQLTAAGLRGAADRLQAATVDAVLGPAIDGGYWTVGLTRPDPRVFEGVEMSAEDTYRSQRARMEQLGLRVAVLEVLRDVDTARDAVAVARAAAGSRFADLVDELDLPARVAQERDQPGSG